MYIINTNLEGFLSLFYFLCVHRSEVQAQCSTAGSSVPASQDQIKMSARLDILFQALGKSTLPSFILGYVQNSIPCGLRMEVPVPFLLICPGVSFNSQRKVPFLIIRSLHLQRQKQRISVAWTPSHILNHFLFCFVFFVFCFFQEKLCPFYALAWLGQANLEAVSFC